MLLLMAHLCSGLFGRLSRYGWLCLTFTFGGRLLFWGCLFQRDFWFTLTLAHGLKLCLLHLSEHKSEVVAFGEVLRQTAPVFNHVVQLLKSQLVLRLDLAKYDAAVKRKLCQSATHLVFVPLCIGHSCAQLVQLGHNRVEQVHLKVKVKCRHLTCLLQGFVTIEVKTTCKQLEENECPGILSLYQ